jgi:hypothetical protein
MHMNHVDSCIFCLKTLLKKMSIHKLLEYWGYAQSMKWYDKLLEVQ